MLLWNTGVGNISFCYTNKGTLPLTLKVEFDFARANLMADVSPLEPIIQGRSSVIQSLSRLVASGAPPIPSPTATDPAPSIPLVTVSYTDR